MSEVELYLGDCLVEMSRIKDGSIDCICADLPYGTTACAWDSVIPFAPLWAHLKRVIKPRGAVMLFGSQPFTSTLIMSNIEWYKYDWVWDKKLPGNFADAKYRPLRTTEQISIFSNGTTNYYPQMRKGHLRFKGGQNADQRTMQPGFRAEKKLSDMYFPNCILSFPNADRSNSVHPTQKPTSLLSYLIRTYTLQGETVLDCTMGSGSTGVACAETGRKFIGIERDETYFNIATKRIADAQRAVAGKPKLITGHESDLDGAPLFSMMESA